MYYIRRGDKEIEKKVEKLTEVVEFMKDEINKLKSDVSLLFYSARSVEKLKEVVDEVRNKVARIEGKLER
jgi:coenzyme F420-reducing hydrogenase delta subunit